MKKITISIFICILFCGLQVVYAQEPSIDSLVSQQKKTILFSHSQLTDALKTKYIQNRFPKDFSKIIKLKRQSYDLLLKIDQTPDFSQKFELLKVSIAKFNKAQSRYNTLLTKKNTQ